MRVKRKQGKYVSVYITDDLIEKWDSIENKSNFVQEAVRNESKNKKQ